MPKREPLEGKIVQIISRTAVVIDKGRDDGVQRGAEFEILLRVPEIAHPDDPSVVVGPWTFAKGRVVAHTVLDRMTYCVSLARTPVSAAADATVEALRPRSVPLPVDESQALTTKDDWLIRPGDPVREVVREEEEAEEEMDTAATS